MATEKIFFAVEIETGVSVTKIEKLRANFKGLAAEIKSTERAQKRGTITGKEANATISKLDKELIKARKAYNGANKAAIEAEKSVSKGARAFLKTEKAAAKASTQLKKTKNVSDSLASTFRKVAAAALAAFAARAIISGIKDAIDIIKNFEQSSANLAAVLGKSVKQMQALQLSAKALGATTSFTASQVVGLQTELAKLGFVEEEILKATEATLALAEASGSDLAQAAKVAGSTIRALGLDAEDMTHLADVMAKSFSNSALDMNKFEESMKLVAPAARSVGVDLETVTAQLGVLANNGISGSVAGTQLNRVFVELNKSGLTLQEAIDQVANSQDKLGKATELVGDRGAKALQIFARSQDKLVDLKKAYQNAGGAAQHMAETQLDTLTGRTKLLSSAWEGFVLSLDSGEGFISKLVNGVLRLSTNALSAATSQEKLSEQLIQTNAELNSEFEVLKNGNITQEQRRNLIDDINNQYGGPGGYIENLLTESSTLKEIEAAQAGANTALKEKIKLVATQEILTELVQDQVEAEVAALRITERIADIKTGKEVISAGGRQTQKVQEERVLRDLGINLNKALALRDKAAQDVIDFQSRNSEILIGDIKEDLEAEAEVIDKILAKSNSDKENKDAERAAAKAERDRLRREKAAAAALKAEQDAQDKIFTFLLNADEKELQALNKKFEEMFTLNAAGNEKEKEFIKENEKDKKKATEEINALDVTNKANELELERLHHEALEALEAEHVARDKANAAKTEEDKNAKKKAENDAALEKKNEDNQLVLGAASKGLSDLQNLTNVFTDNKLRELDRETKEELKALNAREAAGNITRDQAEQRRLKIELDADDRRKVLEKKEFNRNKAFQLAQIGVNLAATLSAIQLAAALSPANPITFGASGIAYTAIQSGIAIGSAVLNAAAISAQKFKQGGMLQQGGIINGPSHANGGVPIMGGRAEVEGNEVILTGGVTKNPSLLAAASRLNVMGGGQSFYQDGGVLSQNLPTFELPSSGGISDEILAAISGIVINSTVAVSEITSAQNNVAVAESQATV